MTIRTDSSDDENDITVTSRADIIDVAVADLTQLARDRYLTDVGERPFDFADDLATILERVSTNVGGPAELFAGQEITANVTMVLALLPDGATTQRSPSPHQARIDAAMDTFTTLARDAAAVVDLNGNSPDAFADDLAEIVSRVSDNLGGPAQLFAGQDITPNVEHVAGLIGADLPSSLPAYRSEPIQVPLYIDSQFETFLLRDKLLSELVEVNLLERDPRLSVEERNEVTKVMQAMRDQYTADKTAYIHSYTAAAETLADQHGLQAPVEVVIIHDDIDHEERDREPLASQLHRQLVQVTPVPSSGKAPKEHPGKSPAAVAPSWHSRIADHPTSSAPRRNPVAPVARPTQTIQQTSTGLSL